MSEKSLIVVDIIKREQEVAMQKYAMNIDSQYWLGYLDALNKIRILISST